MKAQLVEIMACPVCLGKLTLDSQTSISFEQGVLSCQGCTRQYGIRKGIPVLLLKDEYWAGTHTEMQGELEQVNEVPESEHIKRNRYESWRSWNFIKKITIPNQPRILDIGGSSGFGSYLFYRFHPEVVIIDIVPILLKVAEEFLGNNNIPADMVCGGMEWLPFQDNIFDVVLCRQALHHSYNPPHAIREMFRVTKLNGIILIVDEPCLSIGDRIKSYLSKINNSKIQEIVSVQDKLRDADFQYIWTDFRRAIAPLTKKFKVQRSVGFAANIPTPEGIRYITNFRPRGPLGKIMNRVLPRGLGFRGDLNIHAIKTRPVSRNTPQPDYPVVSPDEIEIRDLYPQQKEEYKILFPTFFCDVEW